MIGRYAIHGHAIISADDRIAAADGTVPDALRDEADWQRFQAALDRAAVTVLGRRGHEANPNSARRKRLVLSASVEGIEDRPDAIWWNPNGAAVGEALARAAPGGGVAAVAGGRRVFDLFLRLGFEEFHLARAAGARIPDGIPVFSGVAEGLSADDVLAAHGLVVVHREVLDRRANVTLAIWRREN